MNSVFLLWVYAADEMCPVKKLEAVFADESRAAEARDAINAQIDAGDVSWDGCYVVEREVV